MVSAMNGHWLLSNEAIKWPRRRGTCPPWMISPATFGAAVLPLPLDVRSRTDAFAAVAKAHAHFGRLDVIVNNAGYGQFGMTEELSETEIRQQIETNLFGAIWVTQAALPFLRQHGRGHIVQVSSMAGLKGFPDVSIYCASKWALEGFSQSLAEEVAQFGILVTIVEPGGYSTEWAGSSACHAEASPAYEALRAKMTEAAAKRPSRRGDPFATRAAILEVVDSPRPPLRIIFGDGPLAAVTTDYERRLATWQEWEEVSIAAHGAPPA